MDFKEIFPLEYERYRIILRPTRREDNTVYRVEYDILDKEDESSGKPEKVCFGTLKGDGCMDINYCVHICSPQEISQITIMLMDIYRAGIEVYGMTDYEELMPF